MRRQKGFFSVCSVLHRVIGIIFIVVAFILGILGGGIAASGIICTETGFDSCALLRNFFFPDFNNNCIILILGILSITLYGIASLSFKDTGPFKSIKEARKFLVRYPNCILALYNPFRRIYTCKFFPGTFQLSLYPDTYNRHDSFLPVSADFLCFSDLSRPHYHCSNAEFLLFHGNSSRTRRTGY